ncbi:hypothetical protein N7540_012968 [Penicillium herquei]|nr:hypothetical protein N7540_012968 [Penicillium herquei]
MAPANSTSFFAAWLMRLTVQLLAISLLTALHSSIFPAVSVTETFVLQRNSPKTNKVSVVVDNRLDRKNNSFLATRAQFSALAIEDRIQFLSWLFEGAVSYCTSLPSNPNDVSTPGSPSDQDKLLSPVLKESGLNGEAHHTGNAAPSRKGLKRLEEEDSLLKRLRLEQKLPWSEVYREFSQKFHGRGVTAPYKCIGA